MSLGHEAVSPASHRPPGPDTDYEAPPGPLHSPTVTDRPRVRRTPRRFRTSRSARAFVALASLLVAEAALAATFTWYVPGAVESPGASDAVFSSTLGLTNVGSGAATVTLGLVPAAGKAAPPPVTRTLPAGSSDRVETVLKSLWGLTRDSGTLSVVSDQPLIVSIQTANVADPRGTYGLVLRDPSGQERASAPFSRRPLEWGQQGVGGWFGGAPIPANARVDAVVTAGSVDGYLSRIDNGTGDAAVLPLSPLPVCEPPALTLTAPVSGCVGSTVAVTWQASDPTAVVSIEGIGAGLAASGSRDVTVASSVTFTGRAQNACGTGAPATRTVEAVRKLLVNWLTASPDPVQVGTGLTLEWEVDGTPTAQTLVDSELGPVSIRPEQRRASLRPQTLGSHTAVLTSTGSCGSSTRTVLYDVDPPA